MVKLFQYLFCLFMVSSISLSNIYSKDSTSQIEQGAVTQKKAFKEYLKIILPANILEYRAWLGNLELDSLVDKPVKDKD